MASDNSWYEVVEGNDLEQGDLLLACPVLEPIANIQLPLPNDEVPGVIKINDVVIMTQSCDLVNDKTQEIILCPHWDIATASQIEATLAKTELRKAILKGQIYRYTMLNSSINTDPAIGIRIVDFGRIFSLPRAFVMQIATQQGKRLRLQPPYREHLSQAFARFFMRVGLPQDIELP